MRNYFVACIADFVSLAMVWLVVDVYKPSLVGVIMFLSSAATLINWLHYLTMEGTNVDARSTLVGTAILILGLMHGGYAVAILEWGPTLNVGVLLMIGMQFARMVTLLIAGGFMIKATNKYE